MNISTRRFSWKTSFRIVASRFRPISIFERVASEKDFDALYALESMTNNRIRNDLGYLEIVPKEDRVYGAGSTIVMAPFTHINPEGSRFSDGSYGIYYAAKTLNTSIAETVYHTEKFLRATKEEPIKIEKRVYSASIKGKCKDVRNVSLKLKKIYDPNSYIESKKFGKKVKEEGLDALIYRSVRDAKGTCIAVFKPKAISNCKQAMHLCYPWDGEKIVNPYELKEL